MAVYTQAVLAPDPIYLQAKTYNAQADRKAYGDFIQAGVVGVNDFLVSWTSGMGIQIAGGVAWISGQNIADQGSYREYTTPTATLTIANGSGAAPRIDTIILRVMDNPADGSTFQEARIEIVPGTPTAGADLVNLNGKANLTTLGESSKSVLLLAYVLVPQSAVVLDATKVSDQRTSALLGNGMKIDPYKIAARGAVASQTLIWDGTKYVPGYSGRTLIDEYTVSGSALSVYDTNTRLGGSIPQIYKHLELVMQLRTNNAGSVNAGAYARLNNDSAANYDGGLGGFTSSSTGATACDIGATLSSYSSYRATRFTFNRLFIPDYTLTANDKQIYSAGGFADATYGSSSFASIWAWRNTVAATRIQIYAGVAVGGNDLTNFTITDSWVVGCRFLLYGVN